MKRFAVGIFMWNSVERRTDRYGSFFPCEKTIDNDYEFTPSQDLDFAKSLAGKKVRLACRVLESRVSGHFGDAFHSLFPTQPTVGDLIEIGVGNFSVSGVEYAPLGYSFGLKPSDGRERFWCDPRQWYKLHDQTVEFLIEETYDPETPDPTPFIESHDTDKAISNGDGTIQFKGEAPSLMLKPNVRQLGDGMLAFQMPNTPGNNGEAFEFAE